MKYAIVLLSFALFACMQRRSKVDGPVDALPANIEAPTGPAPLGLTSWDELPKYRAQDLEPNLILFQDLNEKGNKILRVHVPLMDIDFIEIEACPAPPSGVCTKRYSNTLETFLVGLPEGAYGVKARLCLHKERSVTRAGICSVWSETHDYSQTPRTNDELYGQMLALDENEQQYIAWGRSLYAALTTFQAETTQCSEKDAGYMATVAAYYNLGPDVLGARLKDLTEADLQQGLLLTPSGRVEAAAAAESLERLKAREAVILQRLGFEDIQTQDPEARIGSEFSDESSKSLYGGAVSDANITKDGLFFSGIENTPRGQRLAELLKFYEGALKIRPGARADIEGPLRQIEAEMLYLTKDDWNMVRGLTETKWENSREFKLSNRLIELKERLRRIQLFDEYRELRPKIAAAEARRAAGLVVTAPPQISESRLSRLTGIPEAFRNMQLLHFELNIPGLRAGANPFRSVYYDLPSGRFIGVIQADGKLKFYLGHAVPTSAAGGLAAAAHPSIAFGGEVGALAVRGTEAPRVTLNPEVQRLLFDSFSPEIQRAVRSAAAVNPAQFRALTTGKGLAVVRISDPTAAGRVLTSLVADRSAAAPAVLPPAPPPPDAPAAAPSRSPGAHAAGARFGADDPLVSLKEARPPADVHAPAGGAAAEPAGPLRTANITPESGHWKGPLLVGALTALVVAGVGVAIFTSLADGCFQTSRDKLHVLSTQIFNQAVELNKEQNALRALILESLDKP